MLFNESLSNHVDKETVGTLYRMAFVYRFSNNATVNLFDTVSDVARHCVVVSLQQTVHHWFTFVLKDLHKAVTLRTTCDDKSRVNDVVQEHNGRIMMVADEYGHGSPDDLRVSRVRVATDHKTFF